MANTRPSTAPDWTPPGAAIIEPSPARKASGWAVGDMPPAEEFNWFWSGASAMLKWLLASATQRFDSYETASAKLAAGGLNEGEPFILDNYDPTLAPFERVENITGLTFANLRSVACDGVRVWLAAGDGAGGGGILTVDRSGGDEVVWEDMPTEAPNLVAVSGLHVGYTRALGGGQYRFALRRYDKTPGSAVIATATTPFTGIASTGASVIAVTEGGSYWFTNDSVSGWVVSSGTHGTGQKLNDCCAFGDWGWIAGEPRSGAAGYSVAQYRLSSGAPAGGVARGEVFAICTDGDMVFLSGDADGDGDTLECRGVGDLDQVVWKIEAMAGLVEPTPGCICVDDRYVYVAAASRLMMVDKTNGAMVASYNLTAGVITSIATDGDRVYVVGDGGGGPGDDSELHILHRNELPRTVVAIDPQTGNTDPSLMLPNNRKPFPQLFLPSGGR